MKISWLRCFLAVEKHRNFSAAADSLFMTQATLSKQIKALETELGVQLFDRSTHVIKLTQAGSKIIPHAIWIAGEQDHMLSELEDLKNLHRNRITISALLGMSYYDITDMIIDFELAHPEITAETHEKDHDFMMYSLDNHIVDFCIGYKEFWNHNEHYNIFPLYRDSIVIVMSNRHPLSSVKNLSLADARDYMFCLPREDAGFFQTFLDICADVGFSPRLTLSDVRISTIKRYMAHGMRLTVTSALRAREYYKEPDFCYIPIHNAPSITLSLATRNESLSRLDQEFISHAQAWYDTENDGARLRS